MTRALVIPLPGNEPLAEAIAQALGGDVGRLETRRFPDAESYVRLDALVTGRSIAFVCTLDRPDDKALPLIFAADAARELGAVRVGLVAPYLAYMRQDKRFRDGDAITSSSFARLISRAFDWMVTVDPHLHRWSSLADIYAIPSRVVHAAPLLSHWIRENVASPLIVGPDSESEQWVGAVAAGAEAPYLVLEKRRLGDRQVELSIPSVDAWEHRTPVVVDDIVSSARTMIEACRGLVAGGLSPPVCIAVHALFGEDAYQQLTQVANRVVSTNTVPHVSNSIDVHAAVSDELRLLGLSERG